MGTSFYPVPWQTLKAGQPLWVWREPDNPYDPNALAVGISPTHQIGHLKRELASELSGQIDKGWCLLACEIQEITGLGKEQYGINVALHVQYTPQYVIDMLQAQSEGDAHCAY